MASGKVVQQYHHKHKFLRFAVSHDHRYLVGGGAWSEAGIWDVESGEELHTLPSKNNAPYIGSIIMLPDDQHALVCEGTGGLIVNLASGETRELDTSTERFVMDAVVAPQANLLLTSAFEPTVAAKVWDARTFESLATLVPLALLPEKAPCYVDITADGRYAATVLTGSSRLLLWDMSTRMVMRQHDWHDYFIYGG
jgi:WD40 repeat protein